MLVEVLVGARRTQPLEIFRRRVGVEVHRKKLALDQVRLGRLAQADRDVRLAHGEVEFLVGGEEGDADLRIEIAELAESGCQPMDADADRGGDLQVAIRPLAAVGELGARGLELHRDIVRGPVEQFALLRENEAAGAAMEQRNREFLLQRAYLSGNRRLRQAELLARMGETAGLGGGVENLEFIPVHDQSRMRIPLGLHRGTCASGEKTAGTRSRASSIRLRRGRLRARRENVRPPAPPCSPFRRRSRPGGKPHRRHRPPRRRPLPMSRSNAAPS